MSDATVATADIAPNARRHPHPAPTHLAALLALAVGGAVLLITLACLFFGFAFPDPLTAMQIGNGQAAALAALGAALWLAERPPTEREARSGGAVRHKVSGLLALGVVSFGLFHLAHYTGGLQADEDAVTSARHLFSIAPGSALGFALAGLSLLLLDARTRFLRLVSTGMALSGGMVALLVILGHLFHSLAFQDIRSAAPMMPGAALTLTLLCVGILCARPNREPVITIASRSAGGGTARRLLSAVLLLPLLGWLRLLGQEWGLFGTNAGVALYCAATMYGFAFLIWWNARRQRFLEADRLRAEGALRESEERYRLLFAQNPLPMWIYDTETLCFLGVNDAAVAHYGYSRHEFLEMSILDIGPADGGTVGRAASATASSAGPVRHRKKNGMLMAVEVTSIDATFATEGRASRLVLAHDVTEREAAAAKVRAFSRELQIANERLKALATRDGLTGLLNHRVFYERLAEAYEMAGRYNQPLSLLLLDVDRFKLYNDDFGHPAGDVVLRAVAEVLEIEARRTDVVARYGGEEFAILLTHTDAAAAELVAERLRCAIEDHAWPMRPITISVGVASLRPGVVDGRALVRAADAALYASKRDGRNRVTLADPAETTTASVGSPA
jgi:diguanylate cyclase (GGDEF)-like protein/PAS domain S-box-containing protein